MRAYGCLHPSGGPGNILLISSNVTNDSPPPAVPDHVVETGHGRGPLILQANKSTPY